MRPHAVVVIHILSHDSLQVSGAEYDDMVQALSEHCLTPVKNLSAAQIKRLRRRNKASQAVFAAYLNTSPSTVQKWEQGQKKPNGPSLKLLNLVQDKGLEALA